eukprot:m.89580 g.89580  ORF g.89580 m.89580 type:complete len:54 (-) comp26310_c0_seq1:375-536(-)
MKALCATHWTTIALRHHKTTSSTLTTRVQLVEPEEDLRPCNIIGTEATYCNIL